jgi:hypothetical protein
MGKPLIGVTLPAFQHAFKKTNGDVWCSLCGELEDDPIHWTTEESNPFEPSYLPGAHPYAHHYIPRINSEGDAEYCSVCGFDADDHLHPLVPSPEPSVQADAIVDTIDTLYELADGDIMTREQSEMLLSLIRQMNNSATNSAIRTNQLPVEPTGRKFKEKL